MVEVKKIGFDEVKVAGIKAHINKKKN